MKLSTLDRPRPAHPAQVVAAQVDQHEVLGPLLLVGQHLLGQPGVLGGGGSPRPGAGDGPGLGVAAGHRHQRLRAGAHHLEVAEGDVVHVRAGVDRPQPAVDGEAAHRHRHARSAATAPPGRRRRRGCTRGSARPRPGSARARRWSAPRRRPAASRRPVRARQAPVRRPGAAPAAGP